MKFLPLFSTLLAVATAVPVAEEAAQLDVQDVQNVEAESPRDSTVNGVKILPRFSQTQPKDGAQRSTIKYGTFSVSSTRMLQTTKLAKGPCPVGGCYVTGMEATIRYPDGKEANIDTNAWLHHIALFGSGGGQGSIWACGNERPTLRLNTGSKYGLDFPASFMMMIDLMTEDVAPKSLTLEITYEWVPKTAPGYKAAAMYWLTIGEPQAKSGVYSFKTAPSTSGYNGKLLYAIGHMHDGGTDMRLFVNSKMVCKSVMHYNSREGYAPGAGGGSMAGMSHGHSRRDGPHGGGHGGGMEHISDPGACTDFGTVARGDRMTSEAWYDANQHPLMEHNGKKENLMGNMRVYVGPN
jgi:hypothetical protein